MSDLDRLLAPSSIALVGASGDPDKLAGRPYRYLVEHGYPGEIYLVNPHRDDIDGQPCYDSVMDLPTAPDMAMVLVPAEATPSIITECGEAGIAHAIVIASGFAEVDASGEALEDRLVTAAREADVRLLGPNSEGLLNVPADTAASFSSICRRDELHPGPVGFLTQSGAFGGALFQLIQDEGIGASSWVSTGNEADIDSLELLEHLVEDDQTQTVSMYVESLTDGRRLLEIGRRAAETDVAIVAIHAGTSTRGRQATASHTASVASDRAVYEAVFTQAGVTRVGSVDEFVDTVTAFTRVPASDLPAPDGGLGVVSMSGGAAALCGDTAAEVGLPLTELSAATVARIDEHIPGYGSPKNPLDVTGYAISHPSVLGTCVDAVADDASVNAVLIQFGNSGPEAVEAIMDDLIEVRTTHALPIITVFTGSIPEASVRRVLQEQGILVHEDPVRAITTCKRLYDRSCDVERLNTVSSEFGAPIDAPRAFPFDAIGEVTDRLRSYDVNVVEYRVIDEDDPDRESAAIEAAASLGYPVVVKRSPIATQHKSEEGGVALGLDSPQSVRSAVETLPVGDLLVQPHIDGIEVLVGIAIDDDFGPIMTVGPGGVLVELFETFARRALPVDEAMAREMIAETPLDRLLDGYRGTRGNLDELARFIAAASTAYLEHDLDTLEFNPVIVTEDEAVAVDLLIEPSSPATPR